MRCGLKIPSEGNCLPSDAEQLSRVTEFSVRTEHHYRFFSCILFLRLVEKWCQKWHKNVKIVILTSCTSHLTPPVLDDISLPRSGMQECLFTIKMYKLEQDKNNKITCAPSEDSDQLEHPLRLIRVFAVRMKKAWVLSYQLSAQRRLWSDWRTESSLGAQSFCWFCHEPVQIYKLEQYKTIK